MNNKLIIWSISLFMLASTISFAWVDCEPTECDTGWTNVSVTCEGSECVRTCSAELCDLNWTQVHYEMFGEAATDVEIDAYTTSAYTPQNTSLCYRFLYNGTNLSEYQIDIDLGGGEPDPECVGEAIGGFREGSTGSSSSWFQNMSSSRYHGNEVNDDVSYMLEAMRAWGDANEEADEFGPTSYVSGVSGQTNGVTGWGDMFCAPNDVACEEINSSICATGCYSRSTGAYFLQGLYENTNEVSYSYAGHNAILYSEVDAGNLCDSQYEGTNEIQYVIYQVYSSPTNTNYTYLSCDRTNEAPSASDVEIIPTSPNAGNYLVCNFSYSDPEDHPEKDSYYEWYQNGNLTNITTQIVEKGNLSVNDIWYCKVTPSDSITNGTINTSSNNVTIVSTIKDPTLFVDGNLSWSKDSYYNGPEHIYSWTEELQNALDSCTADSEGYCNIPLMFFSNASGVMNVTGLKIYGNVTTNFVPTHDTPILNSSDGTNYTSEDLTCYPQNVQDQNGDSVQNITNWYVNGDSWMTMYLPFEGGTNSTYVKNYGSGYDGSITPYNSPEWDSDGGFLGSSGYRIEYGDYSEYQRLRFNGDYDQLVTDNFTMCLWVMSHSDPEADTWQNDSGIYEIRSQNWWKNRIFLLIGNVSWKSGTSRFQAYIYNDSNNYTDSTNYGSKGWTSDFIVNTSTWYHFCYTFENNISFKIYINGSLNGTVDTTGHWVNISNISTIHIGFMGYRNNITIDEFRIWNDKILSPEQIEALYNNQIGLVVSNETSEDDAWTCEVTPNDGSVDGTSKNSSSLTILSESTGSPSIGLVQLYPTAHMNVSRNSIFNYSTQVCCYGSNCNEINISLDPETEEFTHTSYTSCSKGICQKTLYSGTVFGFEDKTWKKLSELRSFKESTNIQCEVSLDPGLNVDCLDYNYTSMKLRLYPSVDLAHNTPIIPIKVYRRTNEFFVEESDQYELWQVFFINLNFGLISETEFIVPIKYGDIVHFGNTSSTLILQDADSETLEDSMFDEDTTRSGGSTSLLADPIDGTGEIPFIKFNISALPEDAIIESTVLCMREYGDVHSSNDLDIWYVSNQSWLETSLDSICNNSVACDDLWALFTTKLTTHNGDGSANWECMTGLSSAVQTEYDLGHANLSFALNNSGTNTSSYYGFYSKEYYLSAYRPYLNITYSISSDESKGLVPTWKNDEPFYTNGSNPVNIFLNRNECYTVTWWVNASGTGTPGITEESRLFFTYANITSNMSISNVTDTVNITIIY